MKNRAAYISVLVFVLAFLASCTSARWTVKDQAATDQSDFEVLEKNHFLVKSGEPTPQDPVLRLDLFSRTKYQYTQRVLVQRNIQDYRLRPGFFALGVAGAAAAFYAANSSILKDSKTSVKSVTLNTAGALLLLTGFLNMKPVGEPRPTGEERFLRSTGNIINTDTVRVQQPLDVAASVAVLHNGNIIFTESNRAVSSSQVEIPLGSKLNELQLSGPDPGSITVNVNFSDSAYRYEYPVEAVLQPYARVTSQITELRNSPEMSEDNILADLVQGSRVQISDSENNQWHRVLYGISESYVLKEDTELIWRTADFATEEKIVTVPRVPFGNIDVETNIPILRGQTPNAVGLIITNQNYSGDLQERNYAHRDGRLIKTYLENALGFQQNKIFELTDISGSDQLYRTLSEIRFVVNDSTEFFVFLSGYGSINYQDSDPQLSFLPINSENRDGQPIGLSGLFEQISSIPSSQTLVVGDIDFSRNFSNSGFSANEQQRILESHSADLTFGKQNTSILLGAHLNQSSSLYLSANEDKKHHIFPYFFAKAIQERNTNLSAIYQYLERNVSYNARRLHERPQDPVLLGNSGIDLAK